MTAIPIWLVPIVLIAALCTIRWLTRHAPALPDQGRFLTIDGLRGYLAVFVFIHHSVIWYFFLQTGRWETPVYRLYAHFGQASVALFFMITAFLFYTKILDQRKLGMDWLRLYVGRTMRLMPLYFFAMGLLFTITAILTNGELRVPSEDLWIDIAKWFIFEQPNLNGLENTRTIIAEVVWSLQYEWIFYLALPLIALIAKMESTPGLILTAFFFATISISTHNTYILAFLCGVTAAYCVRSARFVNFCHRPAATALTIACLMATLIGFKTTGRPLSIFWLGGAFILVAGGCSLHGILTSSWSRLLGEITYSIYLLHGIFIFTLIQFVITPETAKHLSPTEYFSLIAASSPILVILCWLSFRYIERPAILHTPSLTLWLKRRVSRNTH